MLGKFRPLQVQVIEALGTASLNNEHESLFSLGRYQRFLMTVSVSCSILLVQAAAQVRHTISSTDFRSDTKSLQPQHVATPN